MDEPTTDTRHQRCRERIMLPCDFGLCNQQPTRERGTRDRKKVIVLRCVIVRNWGANWSAQADRLRRDREHLIDTSLWPDEGRFALWPGGGLVMFCFEVAAMMQEPMMQIGGGSHNLEVIVVLVDLQQSI